MRLSLLLLPFIFSCAKLSYITDQSIGQIGLLWNGVKNEKILKDPEIDSKLKEKIQIVEKAKKFFYNYFEQKTQNIYSKTVFLDRDEVTTLVIVSPRNKIKAKENCFLFAGCFPYLGFFSKKKAVKYKSKMEKEGYHVYMRPVYAYSTLGYFTDPILSSFFEFSNEGLIELVFHELFHTIFFIKNDVSFNENMAQYFARKLNDEYSNSQKINTLKVQRNSRKRIRKWINKQVKKLEKKYEENSDSDQVLKIFLPEFKSKLSNLCEEYRIKNCYEGSWNNARFVEYLVYEEKEEYLEKLHQSWKGNLKDFYLRLEAEYSKYNGKNGEKFSDYLESKYP